MLSLYHSAIGFISENEECNPNKIPSGNLILEKVVDQQKIMNLKAAIIHFYFQCAGMAMNNISTSGGLA